MSNFADDEPLRPGAIQGPEEPTAQPEEELLSSGVLRLAAKVEYSSLPKDAAHTVFGLVSLSSESEGNARDDAAKAGSSPTAAVAPTAASSMEAGGDAQQPRAPMDIVCVLDVSGSMSGAKIQLLKDAVMFLVDELGPDDRLTIASFNHEGERLTSLARMTPEGRDSAKMATMRLTAGGGTHIPNGLEVGLQTLEQRRQRNAVSAVFLLTDGQDGTSRQQVEELVQRCRRCGASLYAFGFGADHDARLLGSFAEAAQTPFTFVEAPGAINAAFAGALGGLMSVVAQRALVRIECQGGAQLQKVHTVFSSRPLPDGKPGALVEIPDLFAGERKDLLVELKVPEVTEGTTATTTTEILQASVCYYDLNQKGTVQQAPVSLELERRPASEQPEAEPDEEVQDHRQRVEVTNAMEAAMSLCDRGEFETAQAQLAGCQQQLEASAKRRKSTQKSVLCAALETELEDAQRRVASSTAFRQGGMAEMMDAMKMHQMQRCTNVTANVSVAEHSRARKVASKAMYSNRTQMACIQKSSAASSSRA